jgi:hypothetical protein
LDKLSTPTRVVHNLGLAACFGGTLFGKVAFNPSLSLIGSKTERGKVGGTTCNRFNALKAASFVLAAATWLPQRFGLTGERRHLRVVRNLLLAKDVLMGVAGSVGLSVLVLQIVLYCQAPKGAVPLETGGVYRQRRRLIGGPGSRGP